MSSIFTVSIFMSALELGCIYALVALALFISFTILNIADLTTDGCFTLGCAVGAMVSLAGHPFLALIAAMVAGVCAGFVTAFLQTRLGVESILAGIIVNTGLYTINIAVMGFSSIANLFGCDTVFSLGKDTLGNTFIGDWYKVVIVIAILLVIALLLWWFLGTTLGMSIRATGDNADMVKSSSINPTLTITVGLCIANSLTGLSGALIAQYQKSADINIGTGMVTIALASLIIGQTLIGNKGSILRRILGTILGSVLYRFIVAIALRLSVPAEALKLVSAIIVAVAIATPYVKRKLSLKKREFANYRGSARKEGV
ncbi:MAG: ABC transporter permease [Pseudobutyrivibrio ruminis]|uniref:ABC transporter permease n=1 Tax=Pseudobutyrivibrio ruminis TaxID=46206 RepID=A0A927U895_9FIRM|nr:ABC transporter permease [Pseudobutyrivibrio sp.]MBE5918966.1 ABC transporter permease [Pseudobutyrivibrio ruminis]MBQ6464349.1 ABC transporter permease [Pseudobutyrivibrio sp.]